MRILRRDNVREGFDSVRGLVLERVLFNMPIKLLQRINDIIPDLSVIRSVRYQGAKTVTLQPRSRRAGREKKTHSRGLGIRILERCEFGSFVSRFFRASLASTNDETWSWDSSLNDRGSGGGRRALTRTEISSTHGRTTHLCVDRRTKRILRSVAAGSGLGLS